MQYENVSSKAICDEGQVGKNLRNLRQVIFRADYYHGTMVST